MQTISFNSPTRRRALVLSTFYKWGKSLSGRLSNFPKVPQREGIGAGIWTQTPKHDVNQPVLFPFWGTGHFKVPGALHRMRVWSDRHQSRNSSTLALSQPLLGAGLPCSHTSRCRSAGQVSAAAHCRHSLGLWPGPVPGPFCLLFHCESVWTNAYCRRESRLSRYLHIIPRTTGSF